MSSKNDNTETSTVPEVLPEVLNVGVPTDVQIHELAKTTVTELRENAVSIRDVEFRADLVKEEDLVGVPFLILGWRINRGAYTKQKKENVFVSVYAKTVADDRLVVFNDGGTGVCETLLRLSVEFGRQDIRIDCPDGLAFSEYWVDEETNETFAYKMKPTDRETIPAKTYRIA